MNLLNHKKLNHLVSELNRKKPHLVGSLNLKQQMMLSVPAVLLAKQIKEFTPELLEQDEVTVIVAGAAFHETMNKCRSFYLLNSLLNTNITWKIYLIGNETASEQPPHNFEVTKHFAKEPVSIELSEAMLGPSLDRFGLPDILVMNHPGFESHYQDWLINDDGLNRCLKASVPIVGCSYGTDEIQIDSFYADAFGLTLKHTFNGLFLDMSPKSSLQMSVPESMLRGANSGMMDWGKTIWKIDPAIDGTVPNNEKLDYIRDMDIVRSAVNRYLMLSGTISEPYECYDQYIRWQDGRRILRVYANYSLDITNGLIFDEESNQVMNDDVELDCSDVPNMNNLTIHDKLVLMTQAFQNYVSDNLDDGGVDEIDALSESDMTEIESHNDLFSDSELVESMLGGLLGPEMEGVTVNDIFGFRDTKELSLEDEEITNLAHTRDVQALDKYPTDVLARFTDEDHKNLIHIAAAYDDLELLNFAMKRGVPMNAVDRDNYSVLDICCEAPTSLQVMKYLLENGLVKELVNRQDPRGFTAIYRAVDSGSKEAFDLLLEYGADPSVKAVNGFSAQYLADRIFKKS